MRKEHHSRIGLFTIGITALFLAGFFLLVVFRAERQYAEPRAAVLSLCYGKGL